MFKIKDPIFSTQLQKDFPNDYIVNATIRRWNEGSYIHFEFISIDKNISILIYDADYPELVIEMSALFDSSARGKLAEEFMYQIWWKIFLKDLPLKIRHGNGYTMPNPVPEFCKSYWDIILSIKKKEAL